MSCKPDGTFCNARHCKSCEPQMLESTRLAAKREHARMTVLQSNRRTI